MRIIGVEVCNGLIPDFDWWEQNTNEDDWIVGTSGSGGLSAFVFQMDSLQITVIMMRLVPIFTRDRWIGSIQTHGPIRRFRVTEESCRCWNGRAWLVTK